MIGVGGDSRVGYPLEIALGVVELTWIELTVHWIFSDCDLGEVSVYTPSKGCVGLRVYGLHTGVRGHVANMCPRL